MKRSLLCMCVCGALLCPRVSLADTYHFLFVSGGTTVTFNLPDTAVPYTYPAFSVFDVLGEFSSTDLGFKEEAKYIDFYYGNYEDRPLSIYVGSVYGGHDGDLDFDETGDFTIYTGPRSAAMFRPGTYTFPKGNETIGEVSSLGETYGDTLTISLLGSGTSATPEPGMMTLMGSGALAGAAALRRRLRTR